MNKKIFKAAATTLFVSLCAVNAFAEAPTVTLGGKVEFRGGVVNQKEEFKFDNLNVNTGNKVVNSGFASNGALNLEMKHKVSDVEYGAKIDLALASSKQHRFIKPVLPENDLNAENLDNSIVDGAMAFVKTKAGSVEVGAYSGAVARYNVNASQLDVGMGISGAVTHWINPLSGDFDRLTQEAYKVSPGLYLGDVNYSGKGASANRISLISPVMGSREIGHVVFAVDYIPHTDISGTTASFIATQRDVANFSGAYKNAFRGVIRYDYAANDFFVKASATGEIGKAKNDLTSILNGNKLRGYEVGAAFGYKGVSIAAAYGDAGKPGLMPAIGNPKNTTFWNAGVRWQQGPTGVSLTYSDSKRFVYDMATTNRARQIALGGSYNISKGMALSVEAIDFKLYNSSNRGKVYSLALTTRF